MKDKKKKKSDFSRVQCVDQSQPGYGIYGKMGRNKAIVFGGL